jgi:hypothetical protein
MSEDWFYKIEANVVTQVEYMLSKKYPTLKCTTVSQNDITHFPTLYLHELQPVEAGMDLTNESVNAVLSTIEIQVWTNTTELDCKNILAAAILEMKRLGFNVTMFPSITTNSKIRWGVARFRRMIGNGDDIAQ